MLSEGEAVEEMTPPRPPGETVGEIEIMTGERQGLVEMKGVGTRWGGKLTKQNSRQQHVGSMPIKIHPH